MNPIELRYSEETVRKAVKKFYRRTVGISLPVVFGLMLVFFVYLLWTGNTGWIIGVVGSVLTMVLIVLIALYVGHYRQSMRRFRAMKDPSASLELHDDSLTITADSGSNKIPHTAITEVWVYDEFWLVFLSRAQFFTIPKSDLSSDTQAIIGAKFNDWGLKII